MRNKPTYLNSCSLRDTPQERIYLQGEGCTFGFGVRREREEEGGGGGSREEEEEEEED